MFKAGRHAVVLGFIAATMAPNPRLLAQDAQKPVFRSGVRLVRLDVRVVDGHNRPIVDLRPDELKVTEGGVNRPILLFQRVAGSGDSYVEAAQRTIASEVSTNQGAPQGHLFVLLFDQDHIQPGNEQPVRAAADAFLRDHVRRHDRVAVFGLPGPGPAQPFTANVTTARQQLANVRGGFERKMSGPIGDMTLFEAFEIVRGNDTVLSRFTTTNPAQAAGARPIVGSDRLPGGTAEEPAVIRRLIRENAQTIVNRADESSRRFLLSAADLLRSLSGIDGRKTIVLFSEGFYSANVTRELENVARAAAETYSVIYAVDLNRRLDLAGAETTTADDPGDIDNRLVPLGNLATETSGQLVKDASVRLSSVFQSLLPDESYYLIGFEPAQGTSESDYRRVRLDVTRSGAKVVTRSGYALGAAPTPASRRRAIDAAIAAPFTQQGLKVEYTTYIGQSATPGQQRVALSLVAELPVRPDNTTQAAGANADVVFVVRDAKTGRVAASGSDELALPSRTRDGFGTGSSGWRTAFDLASGDYIMRCVVREPGGVVGSADRRFSVRQLSGFDVAASDLVLSSPADPFPVRTVAYSESVLTGAARVYARTADKLHDVTSRLDLLPVAASGDEPATARTTNPSVGPVVDTLSGATRDVLVSLPLAGLTAGPYIARLVVRSGSEVVATLQRPVEIVVGSPPAAAANPAGTRASDILLGQIGRRLVQRLAASPRPEIRQAAAHLDKRNWAAASGAAAAAPADDVEAAFARGLADLGREDYAAAADTFGLLFERGPDDAAAVAFVLGWARRATGDGPGAIGAFRNAAHLEPAMVPAHLALASTYKSLGQSALAVQAIESGLRTLPGSPELQAMLADLKRQQ